MKALEGRVALVTGAGRGLGPALARSLAEAGADVAANDLSPIGLEPVVAQIRAAAGTAQAFVADVSSKMAVQAMIEEVRDAFGRLDILVNHAEVEPRTSLLAMDEWDWDRTLGVNLKGAFLLSQSAARVMAEQGGGVIVNLASVEDREGPAGFRAAYLASQTGLLGLTRESARELAAYNIRVHAVLPGVMDSERTGAPRRDEVPMAGWLEETPLTRPGRPEDVVDLVLRLCTESPALPRRSSPSTRGTPTD